jgi:hypothetical protein
MGRVEDVKLPDLQDRMNFGGYTIIWDDHFNGFMVWDDNGPITAVFPTMDEAMAWTIDNPKPP